MTGNTRKQAPARWAVIGATFIIMLSTGIGAMTLLSDVETTRDEMRRVATLPDFAKAPVGKDAVLVGVICPDAKPVERDLVAYCREEEQCRNRSHEWVCVQHVAPTLPVDTATGSVTIENPGYVLRNPPVTYAEKSATPLDTATRLRGIRAGTPVLVMGEVVEPGENGQIHAKIFFAGDRAAFLKDGAAKATREQIGGWMLWFVTLAVGVGGGFFFRYLARPESRDGNGERSSGGRIRYNYTSPSRGRR